MTDKPKRSRIHVVAGELQDDDRAALERRFPNRPKAKAKPKRRAWVNGYLSPEDTARIEKRYGCIIREGEPPSRKRK